MRACVILDDYQGVAQTFADWAPIADQVTVSSVREPISDEDEPGRPSNRTLPQL
jgi:hypothetical protein